MWQAEKRTVDICNLSYVQYCTRMNCSCCFQCASNSSNDAALSSFFLSFLVRRTFLPSASAVHNIYLTMSDWERGYSTVEGEANGNIVPSSEKRNPLSRPSTMSGNAQKDEVGKVGVERVGRGNDLSRIGRKRGGVGCEVEEGTIDTNHLLFRLHAPRFHSALPPLESPLYERGSLLNGRALLPPFYPIHSGEPEKEEEIRPNLWTHPSPPDSFWLGEKSVQYTRASPFRAVSLCFYGLSPP